MVQHVGAENNENLLFAVLTTLFIALFHVKVHEKLSASCANNAR